MRLFLIETNTGSAGYERVYARLEKNDSADVKHVFIVPDRFTLGVERDICEHYFHDGYTRADVVSFTRFAIKTIGKKIKKCLSKEGTVVLLDKVMRKNAEKLRYYKSLSGYNFAKELFAATASLRSELITPDKIARQAELADGVLKDKLSDIALISAEYEKELSSRYSDTVTRLASLADFIRKEGDFSNTHFYILGFNLYSALQMEVIKACLGKGASVTVPYTPYLYGGVTSQIDELKAFCEENGIIVEKEEAFSLLQEPFGEIRNKMFSDTASPVDSKLLKGRIRLFKEDTPYAEIEAVAREIVYLVRKENYRYKDIAVVCNDASYLPFIEETFSRCDVPCFLDTGYPVSEGVAVRYIIALCEAKRLSQPDVFRLAHHPFSELSREECGVFETYCKKYNVKGRFFREPFRYGEAEEAENIRQKLLSDADRFPSEGKISAFCKIAAEILSTEAIKEKLKEYSESKEERLIASSRTDKFQQLLEEIAELDGETSVTAEGFSLLLKTAVADMKTVLSPDCYDVVFVGNTEESRFSGVKVMFVIGAGDGFFPIKTGDGIIFTSADNENMKRINLPVFPTPTEKNRLEKFVTAESITKPSDRLYVGCAFTDLSGEVQTEGEGFKELRFITGITPTTLEKYRNFSDEELLLYRLVNPKNAYREYVSGRVPAEYAVAVGQYLTEKNLLKHNLPADTSFVFENCFAEDEQGRKITSVSQLESYFACPFRHFLKRGLLIQPDDDGQLLPSVTGNIIHNILNAFFRRYLKNVYDGTDILPLVAKIVDEELARKEYAGLSDDPFTAYILNGIKTECKYLFPVLAESLRSSEFRPLGFEVGFGYRNGENEILITAGNKVFKVRGRIDRVDGRGKDRIIIDYKTGTVKPSLSDVFDGRKIQLYVYTMYYMKKGEEVKGVFYLPVRSGNRRGGRSYACVGQMVNDPDLYAALDNRVKKADGTYLSPTVAFKANVKDGTVKLNRSKNLIGKEDFGNIALYVEKLAAKALEEILACYVEKKPLKGECAYCDYRRICGETPYREPLNVEVEDFAAAVREGEGENA